MPKDLKKKLRKAAKKRGYAEDRADAYVYGTMAKQASKAKKKPSDMYKKAKSGK